jgi:hypothetical protein
MLRFADLEGKVEQPRRTPREEAPAQDARSGLLALQRAAGNQAVTRMLQRSVKIGARLGNGAVEHTDAGGVAALMGQLAGRLAAPGWLSAWVQGELNSLVTGGAPYDFDTADQVLDWLLLREVTSRLQDFVARNKPRGAGDRGKGMMATYQKVEALRTAQRAGRRGERELHRVRADLYVEEGGRGPLLRRPRRP